MAGEEVVGGIVGFLRLDADDFHREITRAIAEVKVLSGMDAKVHVEATGVRKAETDLLKVGAAAKIAGNGVGGLERSFSSLGGSGGGGGPALIVGGIVAGMALLGPITGAATAAMAGFVGVAGTAALAYVGFKKEIEDGTALGKAMESEVAGLKGAFQSLGQVAAGAMAGDVLNGMRQISDYLPSLNDEVGTLATSLGRAFRVSITGLLTGLDNMMPLLQDGGRYAEELAQKFATFADSQDFKDFIAYAREKLPEVVAAMASLGGGIKDLTVALAPAGDSLIEIINLTGKFASGTATVIGWLGKLNDVLSFPGMDQDSTMAKINGDAEKAAPAVENVTAKMAAFAAVQSPLAAGLGTTDAALAAVADKHAKTAQTADDATLAMQLEGNAAGLLKQALDTLNGKSLDVASAQTSAAAATLGVTSAMKENGTTLDLNTEKGVKNRQAIERKVAADQAAAEATAKATGSTAKGTEALGKSKTALENALRAQGKLTPAVQKYIDKIYKVPKVAPTKAEFEASQAKAGIKAFQSAIDRLHGKTVTAKVRYVYTGKLPNGGRSTAGGQTFADGGEVRSKIPGYAGGTVVGPGTGRSDSILAGIGGTGELIRISNGEFIATDRSRRRNQAALEAGNNGAKLGVVSGGGGGADADWDAIAQKIAAATAAAVYQGSRRGIADRDSHSARAYVGGLTTVGQT